MDPSNNKRKTSKNDDDPQASVARAPKKQATAKKPVNFVSVSCSVARAVGTGLHRYFQPVVATSPMKRINLHTRRLGLPTVNFDNVPHGRVPRNNPNGRDIIHIDSDSDDDLTDFDPSIESVTVRPRSNGGEPSLIRLVRGNVREHDFFTPIRGKSNGDKTTDEKKHYTGDDGLTTTQKNRRYSRMIRDADKSIKNKHFDLSDDSGPSHVKCYKAKLDLLLPTSMDYFNSKPKAVNDKTEEKHSEKVKILVPLDDVPSLSQVQDFRSTPKHNMKTFDGLHMFHVWLAQKALMANLIFTRVAGYCPQDICCETYCIHPWDFSLIDYWSYGGHCMPAVGKGWKAPHLWDCKQAHLLELILPHPLNEEERSKAFVKIFEQRGGFSECKARFKCHFVRSRDGCRLWDNAKDDDGSGTCSDFSDDSGGSSGSKSY